MADKIKVVIAGKAFDPVLDFLRELLTEADVVKVGAERLKETVRDADVLVPTMVRVGEDILVAAPKLKLIQQWGSGLEGVDVDAASRHGVAVANVPTPGTGNAESVAEWCVMAAIALGRGYPAIAEHVRKGDPWGSPTGRALLGHTAGIIGVGGIGTALAQRLKPFGMRLIGVKRSWKSVDPEVLGLEWIAGMDALPRLLKESEFLFLCLPLTPETRGIVGREQFALLPSGALVVNGSRGGLIDRQALEEALDSGHVAGAGMDVYWEEPTRPNDPLFARPNVVCTPHIAGSTDVAYRGIGTGVADNIRRAMRGEPVLNCVNPDADLKYRS